MTATELQNIARVLSNSSWCRYWLNFYNSHSPVIMAIQCRDDNGKPLPLPTHQMKQRGFTEQQDYIYIIKRTDEFGIPYESKIF